MIPFNETQKFRQWWIWLSILLPIGIVLYILFTELILQKPIGQYPMDEELLIALFILMMVGITFLFLLRLETSIDREGIAYRFSPFHFRPRQIVWGEIESAWVREYKPMKEYGGWGIRMSVRNGRAYHVRGNKGLQLVLKNGRKILLGTQEPEEIERVLVQLKIPGQRH
jgi:hypothetical protein